MGLTDYAVQRDKFQADEVIREAALHAEER